MNVRKRCPTTMVSGSECRLGVLNWLVLARASWSLVTETGPARAAHAAAWDSKRFIVHGGSGEGQDALWIFDGIWTRAPAAASERKNHIVVWDPSGEAFWLHGGCNGSHFLKDMWTYKKAWLMHSMHGPSGPSARSEHVAVWDASQAALYIHGGFNGQLLGDLWRYNSAGWMQIATMGAPSARSQHVAAFDDTRSVIWLHGGYDGSNLEQRFVRNANLNLTRMSSQYRSFVMSRPHAGRLLRRPLELQP